LRAKGKRKKEENEDDHRFLVGSPFCFFLLRSSFSLSPFYSLLFAFESASSFFFFPFYFSLFCFLLFTFESASSFFFLLFTFYFLLFTFYFLLSNSAFACR